LHELFNLATTKNLDLHLQTKTYDKENTLILKTRRNQKTTLQIKTDSTNADKLTRNFAKRNRADCENLVHFGVNDNEDREKGLTSKLAVIKLS